MCISDWSSGVCSSDLGSENGRYGYGRFVRLDRRAADVRGNYYVCGQVRWAPADKPFTLTVSGDYTRFRDSGQLTGLVGYNPDFELSPGFTVGDAVAGTGIDPNDYLLNKKNFYSSYGYKDTGAADLDKPQNRSSGQGVSATLDVRSEEHKSEIQSLMRHPYGVFMF